MNATAKPRVVQTAIPGTEPPPRRRRTQVAKAEIGDLVIAYDTNAEGAATVVAIEQVTEMRDATEIVERWKDQGIVDRTHAPVEVWEARPGMYYRKRSGR